MTDVVTIAKRRRARLLAEIRRLNDFIRMGEALEKLDQNAAGPLDLPARSDSATDDATAQIGAPAPLFTVVAAKESATRPRAEPAPLDCTAAEDDQFHFTGGTPAREPGNDVLVLNDPMPGDPAKRDPVAADPASVDVHIGQKLRQRRWMVGLSRNELGRQVGVASEQIHKYEAGEIHISSSRMWDIAAALNVPMSYFFEDIAGQAADASEARAEILTGGKLLAVVTGDAPELAPAAAAQAS